MIKTTIFNNTKKAANNFSFRTNDTNYSAILDALISADIMKKNSYLKKYKEDNLIDRMCDATKSYNFIGTLKGGDIFTAAANYLALFGKSDFKRPYIFGHKYYFDGTPIIFHFDSIEIDGTEYYYDDFENINNLYLPEKNKKLIIDIYTHGNADNLKININI